MATKNRTNEKSPRRASQRTVVSLDAKNEESRRRIGKKIQRVPRPDWRKVPAEGPGEGQLTGHCFARDLMAFAKENPEGSFRVIEEAMKLSLLESFAGLGAFDNSKSWAAISFQCDMIQHLVEAAQYVDYEKRYAIGADDAEASIAWRAERRRAETVGPNNVLAFPGLPADRDAK